MTAAAETNIIELFNIDYCHVKTQGRWSVHRSKMHLYGLWHFQYENSLSQGTELAKHPSHFVSTGAKGLNELWWSFHHLYGHLSFTYNFATSRYYTFDYSVTHCSPPFCSIISITQTASGSLSLGFSCRNSSSSIIVVSCALNGNTLTSSP